MFLVMLKPREISSERQPNIRAAGLVQIKEIRAENLSNQSVQRVLNDVKRARLSRGLMIWLLAHPLPSVSSAGDTEED